jgi:hypothetical protein
VTDHSGANEDHVIGVSDLSGHPTRPAFSRTIAFDVLVEDYIDAIG